MTATFGDYNMPPSLPVGPFSSCWISNTNWTRVNYRKAMSSPQKPGKAYKMSKLQRSLPNPAVSYRNLPKIKSPWKYSKAQLKAHLMLPEPLTIPKSVLYDYRKKKPRVQSSRPYFSIRSNSTESTLSNDSYMEDYSDTCSEHSEWDSLLSMNHDDSSWNQHSRTLARLNSHVIPLPLSPGRNHDIHTSKPASSSGQLHFQCARCFIMYPSVTLIEQHIGQFHMRLPEGEVFQLSEDNFSTLVKTAWDGDLSGFRRPDSQVRQFDELEQLSCTLVERRPAASVDGDSADSGLDTDESDCFSPDSSVFDEDIFGDEPRCGLLRSMRAFEMGHELGMPLPLGVFPRMLPKAFKMLSGREKMAKLIMKKSMRKCRGVYGIDSQEKWCSMCRWKKRCSRFSQLDDGTAGEELDDGVMMDEEKCDGYKLL